MHFRKTGAAFISIGTVGAIFAMPLANAQDQQSNEDTASEQVGCQSMTGEDFAMCECIFEKARAAGVSDPLIKAAVDHPMTQFHPPGDMDRVTFAQVRKAQQECKIEVRYAQITGDNTAGDGSNPQPDGSYVARPMLPTPRPAEPDRVPYDGPCGAGDIRSSVSPIDRP